MRQSSADRAAGGGSAVDGAVCVGGGGGGHKGDIVKVEEGGSIRDGCISNNDGASAAAATSTGPYTLKVLTCRQLNGIQAIRAAFPRQLEAAVASGHPQEVVLLYQKASGAISSGSAATAAGVTSGGAVAAVSYTVLLQAWVRNGTTAVRLGRTTKMVRDLGLVAGDRIFLTPLPLDGRAVVKVAAAAAAAAAATTGVMCIVPLSETYVSNKVYIPIGIIRQLYGDEIASRTRQVLPVKLADDSTEDLQIDEGLRSQGGNNLAPATATMVASATAKVTVTAAATPPQRPGRASRAFCYLRSYKNAKNLEDSSVWYVKGISTWLKARGAAPGDSLQLERTEGASAAASMGMTTSGSALATPSTSGSTTSTADEDAGIIPVAENVNEAHVVLRFLRTRSTSSTTNVGRDGSTSSTASWGQGGCATHLPATAAAAAAAAAVQPLPPPSLQLRSFHHKRQQQRQAGLATNQNVVLVPRSDFKSVEGAEGWEEAAYSLRVRWDKGLIGYKALRAAFAPQLLAAGALASHGSSSSSASSSSSSSSSNGIDNANGNSTSSSGGGSGSVCASQEVKLYRVLPAGYDGADDGTLALQEYAVRLYIGKPGSPGLALTRTAGLVRDLGLGLGDRLQLSLLRDGRAVVASAANSPAVVPTVVRLSEYNLKKGVYVPLRVVRQLLGPDVASRTGLGVPVILDLDSVSDPDLLNPFTSIPGPATAWLRSHPGSTRYDGGSVVPYWGLTGLKAWLRACGAVPGDVLLLNADPPAKSATVAAAAVAAAAVTAAEETPTAAVVADDTDGAAAEEAVTTGMVRQDEGCQMFNSGAGNSLTAASITAAAAVDVTIRVKLQRTAIGSLGAAAAVTAPAPTAPAEVLHPKSLMMPGSAPLSTIGLAAAAAAAEVEEVEEVGTERARRSQPQAPAPLTGPGSGPAGRVVVVTAAAAASHAARCAATQVRAAPSLMHPPSRRGLALPLPPPLPPPPRPVAALLRACVEVAPVRPIRRFGWRGLVTTGGPMGLTM